MASALLSETVSQYDGHAVFDSLDPNHVFTSLDQSRRSILDPRFPVPLLDGNDVDIGIAPSIVGRIRSRRGLEVPV